MQEIHTVNTLRQTRRNTNQAPAPFLLSPASTKEACTRLTALTLQGFLLLMESQGLKGPPTPINSSLLPKGRLCCSCVSTHRCFSNLFLRGLQQESVYDILKLYFPVVYHHCLWKNFTNILFTFTPLKSKSVLKLHQILGFDEQTIFVLSACLEAVVLHCVPSAFSSQRSQPNLSPFPCTVEGPGILFLSLVGLFLRA